MNELIKALDAISNAIGDYLPPDGIDKDELINRVIYATDNPEYNEARRKMREASEIEWGGWEARASTGDLYSIAQLSDIVWITLKNGTQIGAWTPDKESAKSVAVEDYRRIRGLA